MATLSILGLYKWDNSIFDGFRVPTNVDKQTAIDNILLECAELEIIYPDFDILKFAIKNWTDKEFDIWDELQKTKEYEYNPIWNKDGAIIETESRDLNKSDSGAVNRTTTEDLNNVINSSGTNTGEGTSENSIMGYNSTSYEKKDLNESSSTNTYTDQIDNQGDNVITMEDSHESTGNEKENITRERIEQGNIGVTTTQKMIQEQREVVQLNIYDYICESFKKRFCLLVY